VGPGYGNKRHGVAIGLTTGRMAVTAGSGRAPARAHGGGRRPAAAFTVARGTTAWRQNAGKQANARATLGAKEAGWAVGPAASAGGELQQRAVASMAQGGSGWRAAGKKEAFIGGLGGSG
jgi:hypothetical protein